MPNTAQSAGTTGAGAGALHTAAAPAATVAPSFHADMHGSLARSPRQRSAQLTSP